MHIQKKNDVLSSNFFSVNLPIGLSHVSQDQSLTTWKILKHCKSLIPGRTFDRCYAEAEIWGDVVRSMISTCDHDEASGDEVVGYCINPRWEPSNDIRSSYMWIKNIVTEDGQICSGGISPIFPTEYRRHRTYYEPNIDKTNFQSPSVCGLHSWAVCSMHALIANRFRLR